MNQSFQADEPEQPVTMGDMDGWNWVAANQEAVWQQRMGEAEEHWRDKLRQAEGRLTGFIFLGFLCGLVCGLLIAFLVKG